MRTAPTLTRRELHQRGGGVDTETRVNAAGADVPAPHRFRGSNVSAFVPLVNNDAFVRACRECARDSAGCRRATRRYTRDIGLTASTRGPAATSTPLPRFRRMGLRHHPLHRWEATNREDVRPTNREWNRGAGTC